MGGCVSYGMPAFKEGLEEWVKERLSPQQHANSENVSHHCAEQEKTKYALIQDRSYAALVPGSDKKSQKRVFSLAIKW